MKRLLVGAAISALSTLVLAADVGVSVTVGEPGFYGRIDIGNVPPPLLIYPTPVVIHRAPVAVAPPPIYLHVPPGHAKHWAKHCHEYGACGRPVYFVRDEWYNDVYVPHYRKHRHERREERRGERHDRGRGHGRDDHGRGHDHGWDDRHRGHGRD